MVCVLRGDGAPLVQRPEFNRSKWHLPAYKTLTLHHCDDLCDTTGLSLSLETALWIYPLSYFVRMLTTI